MVFASALSLVGSSLRHIDVSLVATSIGAVFVIYVFFNELVRYKARICGLGGPKGLPIIGNLHDIRFNAAEKYRQWAKKHGSVFQIQLGNIPVVVVNSAASAKDIFSHNSQALASRPEFYTFHKIVSNTAGTTIGTSPYSDSLKRRRKGAASALNRPSVQSYIPHLDVETRDFVDELYSYGEAGIKPVDPMPMIQRLSLSLALTLNWGVRLNGQEDELFDEITHVEEELSKFRSTTGNLQDYVPLLRLNPFSSHSAKARDMRRRRDKYLSKLNGELDERIANKTHKPCIQANVILDESAKLDAAELMSISLTMLSGGLDTLTTQMAWFIGLLAQRPDIQEKAVQEISKYYSLEQPLCDEEDDMQCAYIAALAKESLRYYCVLRLALPRVSIRDIVYKGVTIPAKTVFFLNTWSCNMDDQVWSDSEAFRPERWLEQPDAPLFTYGIGYRMCAGSLLANRELYLICMRLLNSFRIEQHDDFNSHPVDGSDDPTSLVALPKRYRAKFVPRNHKALAEALERTKEMNKD